jgi:hypothetical protein
MSKHTCLFEDKDGALEAVKQHLAGAEGQVEVALESKIVAEMGRVVHTMTITTELYIVPEGVDDETDRI